MTFIELTQQLDNLDTVKHLTLLNYQTAAEFRIQPIGPTKLFILCYHEDRLCSGEDNFRSFHCAFLAPTNFISKTNVSTPGQRDCW